MPTIDSDLLRVCLWTPGLRGTQTASSISRGLELALSGGIRTLVIRETQLDPVRITALLELVAVGLLTQKAMVLLHAQSGGGVTDRDGELRPWVAELGRSRLVHGIHLPADAIDRPEIEASWALQVGRPCPLSTSCHSATDLAESDGYELAFLSPVLPTQSHPGSKALGSDVAHELTAAAQLPVVWLGGLRADNQADWAPCNAAGIGVLGAFWDNPTLEQAEGLVKAAGICTG